ncbi:MAG: ribosome recycling factor [Gammaproteobacteria bacterium]|nr:ribosome recycling factor [Gammaproteobacteria bacterium]
MIAELKKDVELRMKKSVDALHSELTKLRTGRAHPSLLDHVMVSYYGNDTPLNQVAAINVTDARTLTISPWEKTLVSAIEKAILTANLGLNPATSGTVIRVPMPPLSEERRKEMIKVARSEAENGRVSVRNVRRDANNHLKEQIKKKLITEDEERRAQDEIQKITDRFIKDVDKILAAKEAELMEV